MEFQYRLAKNSWYKYFKQHVFDVTTWIDFEGKIEEITINLDELLNDFSKAQSPSEISEYLNFSSKESWKIKERSFKIFNFFGLWESEKYVSIATVGASVYSDRTNLNPKFCNGNLRENGLNMSQFLTFILKQLDEFIEIFNLYLELIVDRLEPKSQFKIEAKNWIQPDSIFSFNYTNTFQKFYQNNVKTEYLHGRFGEQQNIVLGISDLEDDSLKKLKAYGFTKYHQKLFKDTDYLFLDKYKNEIKTTLDRISEIKENIANGLSSELRSRPERVTLASLKNSQILDINIRVWGHSLDSSDKEYILDLFSLNDDIDRKVRVVVYYFDDNAKFTLLNNLLDILKKDKVEKWMKNKWLIFEKNPEVKL